MTLVDINVGVTPNDRTGDPLRTAGQKENAAIDAVNTLAGQQATDTATLAAHTVSIAANEAQFVAALPIFIQPSGDVSGATDTAAIQAAFNLIGSSITAVSSYMVFANAEYFVNAKMVLTLSGTATQHLFGLYGNHCRITQVNSNTGIFEIQVTAASTPYGPMVEDFAFVWSATPLITDTASVAFGARQVTTNGGGQLYNTVFKNIKVVNCFSAIANTQPTGVFQWQTVDIDNLWVNVYSGSPVQLAAPTAAGAPNIRVNRMTSGQPIAALGTVYGNSFPVVNISACDNVTLTNCEWLEVVNQPLYSFNSVSTYTVSACKSEGSTWDAGSASGFNYITLTQNSYGTVTGLCLNGMTINGGAHQPPIVFGILAGNSSQNAVVNNCTIGISAGTGTLTFFQNSGSGMALDMPSDPNILGLGTGPAVFRMTNSGGTASAAQLYFARNPAGKISANQGDASYTLVSPLLVPEVMLWNTALTTNRTVAMGAAAGGTPADNAWQGFKTRILRTANATGAFTLTVTGLATTFGGAASVVVPIGGFLDLEWFQGIGTVEVGSGNI